LVDIDQFSHFLALLKHKLRDHSLTHCWPCLFVAQIGTDLHTTRFNPQSAIRLYQVLAPNGSMVKGHYTDWVKNPEEYPRSGIGAANVGPEFTAEEYIALVALEKRERDWINNTHIKPSNMIENLQKVVVDSGRWKKWLLADEVTKEFNELPEDRRDWLLKTGSRYIWMDKTVVAARERLYKNLAKVLPNPHGYVVDQISKSIEKYIKSFNLRNSIDVLD